MAVHVSTSNYLRADGLSASYSDRRIFADLTFSVAPFSPIRPRRSPAVTEKVRSAKTRRSEYEAESPSARR